MAYKSDEARRAWRERNRQRIRDYNSRWRKEHKEYFRKYQQRWTRENREKWRAYKRSYEVRLQDIALTVYGGRCACCGEASYGFLTIDHIHGGGSQDQKRNGRVVMLTRIIDEADRTRYQVLCYNCNMGRAHNVRMKGTCPHEMEEKA